MDILSSPPSSLSSSSKCFQNLYIRKNILYHLRLFNFNYNQIKFYDLYSLKNYKYKYYLNSIYLSIQINDPLLKEISQIIPSNIRSLEIIFRTHKLQDYDNPIQEFSRTMINNYDNNNNYIYNNNNNSNTSNYKIINSIINQNNSQSLESLIIRLTTSYNELTTYVGSLPSSVTNLKVIPEPIVPLNYKSQISIPNQFFANNNKLSSLELPLLSNYDPSKTSNILNLTISLQGSSTISSKVPNSVTSLTLRNYLDSTQIHPIDLPKGLLVLSLEKTPFNHPLRPSLLPSTLTHLTFNLKFNQPVSNGWLKSLCNLCYLKFGEAFNQHIPNDALPTSLKTLIFGLSFTRPIGSKTNLPQTLEELVIPSTYSLSNLLQLPSGLKTFKYCDKHNSGKFYDSSVDPSYSDLPNGLTHLTCNEYSNFIHFPSSLKIFTFSCSTKQTVLSTYKESFKPVIPPSIETINFINLEKRFNNSFFSSSSLLYLKSIYFDYSFDLPIRDNVLTSLKSLTHVNMGRAFNQQITKLTFPDSLLKLELGYFFNGDINNLPSSLISLHIDYSLHQDITATNQLLGQNLQVLSIGDYRKSINFNNLPPSLTTLIVYGSNSNFINRLNQIDNIHLNKIKIIKQL